MTLTEVRTEIAAALSAEITAHATLPANPTPPFAAVMWPTRIERLTRLSGAHTYSIAVEVWVLMTDPTAAQDALDGYIDTLPSLVEKHTADWRYALCEDVTNVRADTIGDAHCLVADLNYTITA